MSDGSFTQHLYSLTGVSIKANIISENNNNRYQHYKQTHIREIWLEDVFKYKLAFAKSIWNLNNLYNIKLPLEKPIGQSLIELKIDIHKEIHEIYYGYSYYLNNQFNNEHAIWGRKYTIYSNKKPIVTIQEYFSPYIIHLFQI